MKPHILYKIFMASSTAMLIAGPVIVMLLLGLWLDGLFQTSPILAFIFGMLGFVASVMSLMKILKT